LAPRAELLARPATVALESVGSGGEQAGNTGGVGTTKNKGGNGGSNPGANPATGTGGGGAGGPNGDGAAGGAANSNSTSINGGAGGGGSGGGAAGSNATSNTGGSGGANFTASQVGGAGSSSTGSPGSNGTGDSNGASGAGGGAGASSGNVSSGGSGGSGQEWDASHGSGGGGGGGGGWNGLVPGLGGNGGNGIIVITYTPVISATISAESRNAMEHQAVGRIDASAAVEFGLSVPSNVAVATEGRREIRCEDETPIEASSAALRSSLIPIQWAGSLAFYTDAFMPFEAAAVLYRDTLGFVEFACVTSSNIQFRLELLTIPGSEALLPAESLTNGARISADGPLCLEWVDPPSLLMVAAERLLRLTRQDPLTCGARQYSSAQR
jgi:hypothetical protein